MEDGHVLLQPPHGAQRLGRELAAGCKEVEDVLTASADHFAAGAKTGVHVTVDRQAQGPCVHAPLIGLGGASALESATAKYGLWRGRRSGSAATAHSRSSSQAMIWAS